MHPNFYEYPPKMERIKSGVNGLDELIEGGFPKGRSILIAGGPGTGKTTLGLQFLVHGAMNNEPGVAVSFEENPAEWREDMANYGIDLESLEKKKKLVIIDASLAKLGIESDEETTLEPQDYDLQHVIVNIITTAKEIGAKRVLVDNLSALDILSENPTMTRKNILTINYLLKANDMTSILLTETSNNFSSFDTGVEAFVADSLISLHYNIFEEKDRYLLIHKMRGTKHSEHVHSFEFMKNNGIVIQKGEKV